MKKLLLCVLTLALALSLASCAPDTAEVTPTPEPTPTPTARPTPTPTPEPTPEPTLPPMPVDKFLELLDRGFSSEWEVNYWIFPGSGPVTIPYSGEEWEDTFRDLLTTLDWQTSEEEDYWKDSGDYPDYFISIDFEQGSLTMHPRNDTVVFSPEEKNSGYHWKAYYKARGAALVCAKIADIPEGPWVRYGLVSVKTADTPEETVDRYIQAFKESYLASGHITDFRLDTPPVLYPDSTSFLFYYSVKPVTEWYGTDAEGWYQLDAMISLFSGSDGYTRLSYWDPTEFYLDDFQEAGA